MPLTHYVAPFTFDFDADCINVDSGTTDVLCIDLYTAIKEAQASEPGIIHDIIAVGSGLNALAAGVQTGLTVELVGNWQICFPAGNYIARVGGGNLIGGPGGDPVAYSAGVQTLLIQSAASTVVTAGGSVPSAAQNAAAVWAKDLAPGFTAERVQRLVAAAVAGTTSGQKTAPVFQAIDGSGAMITATVDANGNRTSVTLGA